MTRKNYRKMPFRLGVLSRTPWWLAGWIVAHTVPGNVGTKVLILFITTLATELVYGTLTSNPASKSNAEITFTLLGVIGLFLSLLYKFSS